MTNYSYKVYADVVFLKYYLVSFILLLSYLLWMERGLRKHFTKYCWKRLFGYSFILAFVATATLLLPVSIRFLGGFVCETSCLCLLLKKLTNGHLKKIPCITALILLVLYYAGGMGVLRSWNSRFSFLIWYGILFGILLGTLLIYKKDKTYIVTMNYGNQVITVRAIADSGNVLREPITGRAVSVMEEVLVDKEKRNNGYFAIPYHSVGVVNGMLQGILVKDVKIINGDICIQKKDMMIALCSDQLSAKGEYQMLLHIEYLEE